MKITTKIYAALLSVLLVLCTALPAFAVEDNVPFRINCAVNGDTSSQRGICWYTKNETDSVVTVSAGGKTQTFTGSCEEWEDNFMHKVLLTGLEADTQYTYTVGNGTVTSAEGTFTTDDRDDKTEFVVIADVQASSLENFHKGVVVLNKALETVTPDFVVNCGDFTNDSTNEEWDYYDAEFGTANLGYTIVPVSGNHDGLGVWNWFNNMFNLDTSESVQTLNGVNYSFDYGNIHCAVLNTNDLLSVTDAQMTWLKNDMNSTDCDWKIVFMHKSPYTLGKDGKWPDALYLRESACQVFDECDVDLVMSGHDHMYLRTKSLKDGEVVADGEGTTYVLSGTAGSKRYEIREFMVDSFQPTEQIAALTIQKNGYGNYFNGTDFSETKESNIGGCFNTVSVDGGTLTLTSYIVSDETNETSVIDTFTLTKETGKNEATYDGDNTTSILAYAVTTPISFAKLAFYTLTNWLVKFVSIVPDIIRVYSETGTF